MAMYAIGDIQGCFSSFQALLEKINFDPKKDQLWLTGDLVNRGSNSLAVLRFVKALGNHHHIVLGNHDLHLLAVYYANRNLQQGDTLQEILDADDCDVLMNWLRCRPLLHYDEKLNYVMTHAGLAPSWTITQAKKLAYEVEQVLQGDHPEALLSAMYGNTPSIWHDSLSGMDRLRCIVNYFTRLRFCYATGEMNFVYKGKIEDSPSDLIPWFDVPNRQSIDVNILFGHWAALQGQTAQSGVYPLDTGCVWGGCLTAMELSSQQLFHVAC